MSYEQRANEKGDDSFNRLFSLPERHIQDIAKDLRIFVKSLGGNVIEEVRPHRVAYSKSMNFRVFLDMAPSSSGTLIISLRKSRTDPVLKVEIKSPENLDNIKDQIRHAYDEI